MFNKFFIPAIAAVLALLSSTSEVNAYGAAHVGYTHVGPSGVYHTGATAAVGPRGAAATTHTTAVGSSGGVYHSASGAAAGGYSRQAAGRTS